MKRENMSKNSVVNPGAVKAFLSRQAFGLAVLVCAAVAFAFPHLFIQWGGVKLISLVVPAIQVIMFGMGTTLSAGDFVRVAKRPWAVAVGVALQFIVMPLVGYALAKCLGFTGELAAGCVLVGAVAGGTASNVMAFIAKADVALSVAMTCTSTLLSPVVTPLVMKALAGCFVEIDTLKMTLEILKVVIVPVAAGLAVRRIFSDAFARHKARCDKFLARLSMAGICFTIIAITAPSRSVFAQAGMLIVIAAMVHNAAGYLAGYWTVRLIGKRAGFDEKTARTVAIEVGMQNGGMAAALAVGVLESAVAALPANIFSIWMDFSGSIIANAWSRASAAPKRGGIIHPVPSD